MAESASTPGGGREPAALPPAGSRAATPEVVRGVLAGTDAWLVGGAVRDALLDRHTDDLDVAVAGDPAPAAKALRRAAGGAAFALSETFGGWRVVGRGNAWQVDLLPLQGGSIEADLALRDFTVNAMAEPVAGGAIVDPHGGRADLQARILRAVGPDALAADPARAIRAVRLAAELGMEIEPATLAAAEAAAPALTAVASERVFTELKRVVAAPDPASAMRLLERAGVTAAVLPELLALHGVDQSVYHHRDVHDHTLEVLDVVARLQADPAGSGLGEHGSAVAERLGAPLADGLTGWGALRFAALLHDIAKPATRRERPDGRGSGFPGHDREGADVARAVLRRLRASTRLQDHVAALTLHHLRLGFLVHERPLSRRAVHGYLVATAPVTIGVTVLTVADRLATRGRHSDAAIAAHLALAREMLGHVLTAEAAGEQAPLVRGDELARELGIAPGPRIGELLDRLEADRFAGELTTREQAIARARELLDR